MHLAKNPNLISVEALQHLIKLAEEHKISKAELLNSVDCSGSSLCLLVLNLTAVYLHV